MNSVVIRGFNQGYEIVINDSADFDQALIELNKRIQELAKDDMGDVEFTIKTRNRFLNNKQMKRVQDILEKENFKVKEFLSDVVSIEEMNKIIESKQTNIETGIIRSGQKVEYIGDLIVLGAVHKGAVISATGNIFVFGLIEGIVHAGYPNNLNAVIVGDISKSSQIRIADVVAVTSDRKKELSCNGYSFLDDLHNISTANLKEVKDIISKGEK